MLGTVGIEELKIECVIGNNRTERESEQTITVNIQIGVDFSRVAKTDHLDDSYCYDLLEERCSQIAKENKFHLIETLAHAIVSQLIKESWIHWAWIRIQKPALINAKYAYVEYRQEKK